MENVTVIKRVRTVDFDDQSSETILLGHCGNCNETMIYQFSSGWPTSCSSCGWVVEIPVEEQVWRMRSQQSCRE